MPSTNLILGKTSILNKKKTESKNKKTKKWMGSGEKLRQIVGKDERADIRMDIIS